MVSMPLDRDVTIRPVREEDLPAISELALRSDPHSWPATLLADSFISHKCYVLEKSGGTLVGLAIFQQVIDEAELLYLVVDKAFQRQGLGELFMRTQLAAMRLEGVETCFLEVRRENLPAQKLYQTLGFSAVGVRKGYYPVIESVRREDALIFRCTLAGFYLQPTP